MKILFKPPGPPLHPAARIVVCADNDRFTLEPVRNPGVTKAREAALAVGGLVAIPEFPEDSTGTDWNDWYQLTGRHPGRRRAAIAGTSSRTPSATDSASEAVRRACRWRDRRVIRALKGVAGGSKKRDRRTERESNIEAL